MKLNNYFIKDALLNKNWNAAVQILANEFAFHLPDDIRIDVMRDQTFIPEVVLHTPREVYIWGQHVGFIKPNNGPRPKTWADIYLPRFFI